MFGQRSGVNSVLNLTRNLLHGKKGFFIASHKNPTESRTKEKEGIQIETEPLFGSSWPVILESVRVVGRGGSFELSAQTLVCGNTNFTQLQVLGRDK
jgi:hypothetical protein